MYGLIQHASFMLTNGNLSMWKITCNIVRSKARMDNCKLRIYTGW